MVGGHGNLVAAIRGQPVERCPALDERCVGKHRTVERLDPHGAALSAQFRNGAMPARDGIE